nr:hypothetical protein [Burkholderiales bacterium]
MANLTAAQVLVQRLIDYGIEYVFCVPGGAIDPLLDELHDKELPRLILCHHESTAGYMAAAYGKITGKPAVVLATAGPGATNLVSGVATANSESAPLIAITGQMDSRTTFKPSHQVIDSETLFEPITKWSIDLRNVETIGSVFDIAYQTTISGHHGATHIAIATDLLKTPVNTVMPLTTMAKTHYSCADLSSIHQALQLLSSAKHPLIIIGGGAADNEIALQIHKLVAKSQIPVVCTFEGAGTINKELLPKFMGRLGLFQNQPCNKLIKVADVILAIGYNIPELDPYTWNRNNNNQIIHAHTYEAIVDSGYRPTVQLVGDIKASLE